MGVSRQEVPQNRRFVRKNPYQYDTIKDIWVNHNDLTGLLHGDMVTTGSD